MDPRIIRKRVASVDNTTASIVGIGAWCSLHASDAPTTNSIVAALCDRIASSAAPSPASTATADGANQLPSSSAAASGAEQGLLDGPAASAPSAAAVASASSSPLALLRRPFEGHKAACLYVLHEMLIAAAMGAIGADASRRQGLAAAIASRLPAAVRHAVSVGEGVIAAAIASDDDSAAAAANGAASAPTVHSLVAAANAAAAAPFAQSPALRGPAFVDDFSDLLSAVLKVTEWWNTPPLSALFDKERLKEMRAPVIAFNKRHGLHVSKKKGQQQQQQSDAVGSNGGAAAASGAVASSSAAAASSSLDAAAASQETSAATAAATAQPSTAQLPRQLAGIVRLLTTYEAAKERFDRLSASLLGTAVSSTSTSSTAPAEPVSPLAYAALTAAQRAELDEAREEVSRRLILAIKALDGRGAEGFIAPPSPSSSPSSLAAPGDGGLLAKLHADLVELQNSAACAPPAAMDEKDDLLGSFF